jgi:predicted aspartyl protease
MTPLFNVTASSAVDILLIIHTPTNKDKDLKALVDSGATKIFFSDSYVREKLLTTYSLSNPLRIRLANGSMSMARHGVHIDFYIGTLKISKEFIVTRSSGEHQIILGYEFLKEFNPQIDWASGTLRISDNKTVQAIITTRIADVKHSSGK